ncbi:AAA family ATPase [uncultured Corynebacterium sp.]|uniref:AAA family ATPase n=1 Tax=uncultured Corynebacterium sp. TaxID=159447 RepID=UPI00259ACE1A|nr:AAA family ATPase [uncultured Corynebacterium sp.]
MQNFTTRKPSCKASFPLMLLAGVEGAGKTWAAIEATGMEQADRAFFIEIGESQADAYGAIPGADFDIIQHNGTLGNIREAIAWAAAQEPAEGKFNMLIIDSMTEIWQLLQDNGQEEANRRARRKGRKVPEEGVRVSMDIWNQIKATWNGILQQCRKFHGPVILTSRLELVTAMDDKGNPTRDKFWKVQAEKNLPFHCQVVVQARAPRQWTMTKIVTTKPELQLQPGGEMPFNDFSVEKLLTTMGIGADAAPTTFVETRPDGAFNEEQQKPEPPRPTGPTPEQQAEKRKLYVAQQTQGILAAEQAHDVARLEQARAYYSQQGDKELAQMVATTIERLRAAMAQQAQANATEVLDAEVVEEQTAA